MLAKNLIKYNKSVHMLFINYKKAYDSIHRESLINTLKELEMPQKLINLIAVNIGHTDIKVKVGHYLSKAEQVTTGQDDAMSPVLFNIALKKAVREARIDKEDVRLEEKNIGLSAYADDIVLLAQNKDQLKRQAKKTHRRGKTYRVRNKHRTN